MGGHILWIVMPLVVFVWGARALAPMTRANA